MIYWINNLFRKSTKNLIKVRFDTSFNYAREKIENSYTYAPPKTGSGN